MAALLVAACPVRSDARGTELLPADDPAWIDLQELWTRGLLEGLSVFTRPLAREEIARTLLRSRGENASFGEIPAARRAEREFARELADLGVEGLRESPSLIESTDGAATVRVRSIAKLLARATDERGDVLPETYAGASLRAYLPGGSFALVDLVVEDIENDIPIGDSILKGSDWYLSVPTAYLALATDLVDVYAGIFDQRWGPGHLGTLLLSDAALAYPGIFFGRTFGERARFTAVTGAIHYSERRWFSAHRLEWAITPDLHAALHEAAAYSSSGFDPLYTIGLVPYTLVQRYLDRTVSEPQSLSEHRNNVLAGFDVSWRFAPGWRIDGEFLVDDLATETATMPHRLAYQGGLAWAGRVANGAANARLEFVKVYRYTYAVYYGENFLQDGVPLGFGPGPDLEQCTAFVERDFGTDLRLGAGCDVTRSGEGFAGEYWDPATPESPGSGSALSGIVETTLFPHLRVRTTFRDHADANVRAGIQRATNAGHVNGRDDTWPRAEIDVRWKW
jgi:hypothetical protein